jgi:hypothetical protein
LSAAKSGSAAAESPTFPGFAALNPGYACYASIDHLLLLDQLAVHIKDRRVLNLIGQYLRRTSERGGSFWDYEKGISLGCPLGPLIGGFFLNALDAAAAKLRLFYVRFMEDFSSSRRPAGSCAVR